MKLVISIVRDDAGKLLNVLPGIGSYTARLSTSGEFLCAGKTPLPMCIDDCKARDVCTIIVKTCKSRRQITPIQSR